MALTSTPTTSDNCLIHRTWNTRAAVPDRNSKAAGRTAVNGRPSLAWSFTARACIAASLTPKPIMPHLQRCRATRQAPPGPAPARAGTVYFDFCLSN
ncbi:hypothetical protein GCM10008164_12950 [Achromobacter xylosoxidans]|nr:hypothetical protein GCM10008164_12950 [Achromobacter xylosoxidans]